MNASCPYCALGLPAFQLARHMQRCVRQHAARDQFLALLDNARRERERTEAALKRLRKLTSEGEQL